jgi:hypothetical protein
MEEMQMDELIYTRLILRNDSTTAWLTNKDQILLKGEVGIEFLADGSVKMKIGDGVTTWENLNYFGGEDAHIYEATVDKGANHIAAITTAVNGAKLSTHDVAIVKENIIPAEQLKEGDVQKYQHTAYRWNGTTWTAFDGNYDASNVYFDSDLTYTATIGALKLGSGKSSDVYAAKGKSLEEVIKRLMAETIAPTITQPSYSYDSITSNLSSSTVECGTKVTQLKWNASFNDGTYSYGYLNADGTVNKSTAAGCTATYSMSCDKAGSTTTPAAQDGTWTLTTPYVVKDTDSSAAVGSITTTCTIAGSSRTPVNNIGEGVDGKISDKDAVSSTKTYKVTGYRAWFCGYKNGDNIIKNANGEKDATAITGAQIRSLGTSKNGSWASSMDVNKMQQMFFAAPAGKGSKPAIADSKTTAPQTVKGPFTVSVEGANGYEATDYDVWYVDNDFPANGSATLNITR